MFKRAKFKSTFFQDEFISVDAIEKLQPIDRTSSGSNIKSLEFSHIPQYSNYQARNYVIGYIGKKLGLQPRKGAVPNSWIALKGKGKLFEPNDFLIEMCEKIDDKFDEFHGSGVRLCEAPFEQLFDLIMKEYPTFLPKVVKLYCKVKFYARLKQLNYELKMNKLNKSVRPFKQNAQFTN